MHIFPSYTLDNVLFSEINIVTNGRFIGEKFMMTVFEQGYIAHLAATCIYILSFGYSNTEANDIVM